MEGGRVKGRGGGGVQQMSRASSDAANSQVAARTLGEVQRTHAESRIAAPWSTALRMPPVLPSQHASRRAQAVAAGSTAAAANCLCAACEQRGSCASEARSSL